MLNSININGYRGIKNIKLDNFSRINIILGENNLGKTSILESVFGVACGANIIPLIENLVMRRNGSLGTYDFIEKIIGCFNDVSAEFFEFSYEVNLDGDTKKVTHRLIPSNLFYNLLPNVNFKGSDIALDNIRNNQNISNNLIGKWEVYFDERLYKSINLTYPNFDVSFSSQPLISASFNDILTHRNQQENTIIYSQLKRERILNEFIEELSNTFGQIKEIDSIPYPDGSSAPVSIMMDNNRYIPIYNFGDGLQRWFNILGSMVYNKNSLYCIEEVDVTFHPQAQKQLAKNLMYYAEKFNNQLFMTSHSIEFVDNFLESVQSDKLENVRIITLKNSTNENGIKHRVLSGTEALKSRELYEMELR